MVTKQIRDTASLLEDENLKAKFNSLADEADRIYDETIVEYESKLDELRAKGVIQDRKPRS